MNRRKLVQGALGALIASAALYIFLRGFDPRGLLRELRAFNPLVIGACAALALLSLFFRALRWRLLLPETPAASRGKLFDYTVIGFMINNIVPARLGEAARAFLLWKRNRYGVPVAAGSLVFERLIDVATYGTFLAMPVLLLPELSGLRWVAYAIFAGLACAAGALWWYTRRPAGAAAAARGLSRLAPGTLRPRLHAMGRELASTLDWAFSARKTALIIALSLLTGGCYPVIILLLYGNPARFGILHSLFAQASAAVGAAIPLSPGYVGTLHSTMLQGLSMIGVAEERARALAILFHAVNYIPVTLAGLWLYFTMNVSIKDIRAGRERMEERETARAAAEPAAAPEARGTQMHDERT